jgi:hypothetical protein
MLAQKGTHVEFGFELNHMVLEQCFDLPTDSLPAWNLCAIFCLRCNIDHLLELGVFKGVNGLQSTKL